MKEAKLLIAGDYHGGYQNNNKIIDAIDQKEKPSDIIGKLTEIIQETDISIVNLEYPVTDVKKPITKYGPPAKSNSKCLLPLIESGFNTVTLATNHIFDFGNSGLEDTINHCIANNLDYVGAGKTITDAKRILYKTVNNIKIAILNFAEIQFNIATDSNGGANPLDIIENVKDIRMAKANADFVFVIIHGGPDLCPYPSLRIIKQYRFYAEEGASAIISHHSRVISGYEIYKNTPIFYGLGNFLHATLKPDKKEQEGLMVLFSLKKNTLNFKVIYIGLNIDKMELYLLSESEKTKINENINEINILLKSNDLNGLYKKWGENILKNDVRYLLLLSNLPNILFRIFRKIGLLNLLKSILLFNKKRFLPIWNIIKNQSHNDNINLILNETFKTDN